MSLETPVGEPETATTPASPVKSPLFSTASALILGASLITASLVLVLLPSINNLGPSSGAADSSQQIPFEERDIRDLGAGFCINDTQVEWGDFVHLVPTVDCVYPHDSEITQVGQLPFSSFPDEYELCEFLDSKCFESFESYFG